MKEIVIDLKGKTLGRAAVEVANILIGKNEEDYASNKLPDVVVKIKNLALLKLDAKKMINNRYYTHSGYLGSLKEFSLQDMWDKDPFALFSKVVSGMLPKNKLQSRRIKKLQEIK